MLLKQVWSKTGLGGDVQSSRLTERAKGACLAIFDHQVAIAHGSAALFASNDPPGPGPHPGQTCHLLVTPKCVPRLANLVALLSEQVVTNWAYSLVLDPAGNHT